MRRRIGAFFGMIVFNTIKKAEHYVKHCNDRIDSSQGGYDWSEVCTYISGDRVIRRHSGDSCGCGCDMYNYSYYEVIGRIKDKRSYAIAQVLGKGI
jgi:hypothetical protein